VHTEQATVILVKVEWCNALLRMLQVCFSVCLKSILRYELLILGTYHPDVHICVGTDVRRICGYFSKPKEMRKKVWEILAWRSVSGLSPQCWGWTKASSGGSCSLQSATGIGFSRILRLLLSVPFPQYSALLIRSCMRSFINNAVFVCLLSVDRVVK
jgi:hypothetical protein